MPEMLEIPLKELKAWLEGETVPLLEPIRAEGANLLNNMRNRLEELRESSEKLLEDSEKEMLKSSPKTYRRARTAYRFARDILETIDGVEIPDSLAYEHLQTLCVDLEKTFTSIGRERAKNFRQIAPYFIFDRRRFDGALKKISDSFKMVHDFSSNGYTQVKVLEDSFATIDKLLDSLDELEAIKGRKIKGESRRKAVEKKIDETEQRIASIRGRDEVSELAKANKEVEELKKDLKRDLRHLQKPFLKFQKSVQSPKYSLPLDETRKLDQYIKHPFEALATEKTGYPQLRRILQGMEDALAKRKLKLKRSRLEKAREQIDKILNKDSMTPLHERCCEAFSKREQLLKSETVVVSRERRTQLEETLNELKKRKKLADSRLALLERRYKTELENIESQKKELEDAVLEITNKSIRIAL